MEFILDWRFIHHAFDASVVGVVIVDNQQNDQPIIYINSAFEDLTGYKASEVLGRNCRFMQGSEQTQPARTEIRQKVSLGQSTTVTLRNYRKDGTPFHNELSVSPIRNAAGVATHYIGFQQNVTQREIMRQREVQTHNQFILTLEHMTDGFASFDQELRFTHLNSAAERMAGRSSQDLLGYSVFTISPDFEDSPLGQIILQAHVTGTPQSTATYLPQGGKWIDATAYPTPDGVSLFARDFTERHRLTQGLKMLEEGISRFIEGSPVPIAIVRRTDGIILEVNSEFELLSGYSRTESVGRTSEELRLWVDLNERAAAVEEALSPNGTRIREVRLRTKSGDQMDGVISLVALQIADEPCIIGTVRDITAERMAQCKLQYGEARYRQLASELQRTLDLSPELIASIDLDGRFMTVNAACQEILGYAPHELIGHQYLEFVHPEDRGMTMVEDGHIVQGRATNTFQNRYLHKNGSVVWIEWSAALFPDDPRIYCVARNITQRRKAEGDQGWLASLVHASQDAIAGLNVDGTIRSWNASAQRLYGYSPAEAIGQPISLLVPRVAWDAEGRVFERVRERRQSESIESIRIHKSGQVIPVLVTISPVTSPTGELIGVSTVAQDMTERRAAERQIQNLNTNLQQQLDYVTGLRQIDRAIASSTDLSTTLNMVLDNVMKQLNVDAATLLLLNRHTMVLEYAATCGFRTGAFSHPPVHLGEGLAGQVALSGQPLSHPDLSALDLLPFWRSLVSSEDLTAYQAVPLIAKGQVLGVLEVFHRQSFIPFSPWQDMFETLAGQAAIATDNAHLLQGLALSNAELRSAYDETIEGWSKALDLRDKETEGHSRRVAEMTVELCTFMGFSPEELTNVRRGALLHDIGKMGIPDAILLKPGELTDEEWVEMKKHPEYAVKLLASVEFLQLALDIPHYHHERWDGTGYPVGLKGNAIPFAARVFAVVDVYDALTSERPYRKAWTSEQAVEHLQNGAGTHFDPGVVQVFLVMRLM